QRYVEEIQVRSTSTGALRQRFLLDNGGLGFWPADRPIRALAFSRDGDRLYVFVGDGDRPAALAWGLKDGRLRDCRAFPAPAPADGLFLPDGLSLVTVRDGAWLHRLDDDASRQLCPAFPWGDPRAPHPVMALSRDGRRLAVTPRPAKEGVRLIDLETGQVED